jgi:hypothetical protein
MKRLLPLAALVLLVAARKPTDPKHENHYAPGPAPASDVIGLAVTDAQSQQDFAQVGVKISNKSSDQLVILMKDEAQFVLPSGAVTVQKPTLFGGPTVILPNDTKGFTFKVDGGTAFHVDNFTLKPAGFYTAPNTGTVVPAPDFQLPPSNNEFTSGPFNCKLKESKQETKETGATFTCTYNGKGIGIVDSSRIGVKVEGKEFANDARKPPRDVLFPGDTTKVTAVFHVDPKVADMQFATMQVLWRDALSESTMTPAPLADWAFTLDAAKTADANK